MIVKIQVKFFWGVAPCSVAVRYQPWRWRQQGHLKHWYLNVTHVIKAQAST